MSLSLLSGRQDAEIDPVCGMTVQPAQAAGSHQFEGRTYYFCSLHCLTKFKDDPRHYLHKGPDSSAMAPPTPAAGDKVEYVCPMDPEVVLDHPAPCPVCGMALEPRIVSADDKATPEETDLHRRFLIGLVLGIPLVMLAMGGMIPGWPLEHTNPRLLLLLQALLATPVVFWCGWPLLVRAKDSFVQRSPNMFTLVGLG